MGEYQGIPGCVRLESQKNTSWRKEWQMISILLPWKLCGWIWVWLKGIFLLLFCYFACTELLRFVQMKQRRMSNFLRAEIKLHYAENGNVWGTCSLKKSCGLKSFGEHPHQSTMCLYWHLQPSLRFQFVTRRLLSTKVSQAWLFSKTVWKKDCRRGGEALWEIWLHPGRNYHASHAHKALILNLELYLKGRTPPSEKPFLTLKEKPHAAEGTSKGGDRIIIIILLQQMKQVIQPASQPAAA